jgi:uncharacterized protein (DUF2252 family)
MGAERLTPGTGDDRQPPTGGEYRAIAARQMALDQQMTRRFPRLLDVKRRKMLASPHRFFRGSAPLFYEILAARPYLVPDLRGSGAIVGDMHIENMGAYHRDDGEVTFDLNDFDEALPHAPLIYDVLRLTTSTLLAARYLHATGPMLLELDGRLLLAYTRALFARGRIRPPPMPEAIETMLQRLDERTKRDTLDAQTSRNGKERYFEPDGQRYLPLPQRLRRAFPSLLRAYTAKVPKLRARGRTLRVEDVAFRVAGVGSLGRIRLAAVMSDGKREWLLDLKEAGVPAEVPFIADPGLDPAEREVEVANRLLPSPPRWLRAARSAALGVSFVGRQFSPQVDKLDITTIGLGERLDRLLETLGHIVGRAHARAQPSLPGRVWPDRKLREILSSAAELASIYEGIYLAYSLEYGGELLGVVEGL